MDLLNTWESVEHHYRAYGGWSWVLDVPRLAASKEDSKRTDMYKQNFQRESLRKQSGMTFCHFIESLQLVVDVQALQPEHVRRVAQMTQRTNRFNTTTVRRTGE